MVQGQSAQFQAYAFDANYDGGLVSTATWTLGSGSNSINSTGLFSATTVGGPFTITATVGSVSGSTGVTVTGGMTYAAW